MEDKLLEMCKKTLKIQNDFSEVECIYEGACKNCPFAFENNGGKESCTSLNQDEAIQLAQNYIKEHEKKVNTIEKIEEKHKYKVGDKVKIRYMNPDKYSEPMVDCGGDIATITDIINSQGNIQYRVKENYYYWDEEILEPVEKNEDISRDLIEGHNFTKATVTLKELQEIKKDNIIPTYYHRGSYDVIQFCNDNEIEFTTGNIIKYITRYKGKNGIEDLKKAKEYLRRLQGTEYDISLADLVHFSLENDLNYTQGKIIELVLGDELTKAGNVLNDLIEKEEKKIKEIEETYQTEGMAD